MERELKQALDDFRAATPNLSIWERWPNVSTAEDNFTDRWACDSVSRECAKFLRSKGIDARLVQAEEAHNPWANEHFWVRVGDVNIDWTARQYYNLEYPAAPEHQNLDCPLVWVGERERHPIVGGFASVTEGDVY